MIVWLIIAFVASLGILTLGFLVFGVVVFRVRKISSPVSDALILAAHSDDCVIGAGEYGIAALDAGRQVRIIYLTRESSPEKAAQRQKEAIAAWKLAGLTADSLEFLDLPQADDMNRRSAWSTEQHDHARTCIAEALRQQPRGTAVLFPAAGEMHVDHRALRQLAQEALIESGRDDFKILQYAEYNDYLSLFYSPSKTILQLALLLPLVGRFTATDRTAWLRGAFLEPPSGFVDGGPPCALAPDLSRMASKLEMLNCFESQDIRMVRGFFSHPDRYQQVAQAQADCNQRPRISLPIGGLHWGPTVICMWLWMCGTVGLSAYLLAYLLVGLLAWMMAPSWIAVLILLSIAGSILWSSVAKQRNVASFVIRWCAALGLIAGVF